MQLENFPFSHPIWVVQAGDTGHISTHPTLAGIDVQYGIVPIGKLMQMRRPVQRHIAVLVRRKVKSTRIAGDEADPTAMSCEAEITDTSPIAILLWAHIAVLQRPDITAVYAKH